MILLWWWRPPPLHELPFQGIDARHGLPVLLRDGPKEGAVLAVVGLDGLVAVLEVRLEFDDATDDLLGVRQGGIHRLFNFFL